MNEDETKTKHSMTWTEYHSKEDMETYLDYLAETYDFVTLETIGESFEGETMRVAKVRNFLCLFHFLCLFLCHIVHFFHSFQMSPEMPVNEN